MAPPMQMLWVFGAISILLCVRGVVRELDERFLEQRKEGLWLVEFYAPWCGHCKKLEPIFNEVAQHLHNSPIKVAKLDSTRYTSVASEFEVRGFPTIKFINKDQVYSHRGDRTKEDLVEFAWRAKGPAVRKLASIGKFTEAKAKHKDTVFFLYIGDDDPEADLFVKYGNLAERFIIQGYFYAGTEKILSEDFKFKSFPTVAVFKDQSYFEFEAPDGVATSSSLEAWITAERFPLFPLVSGGAINEIADTKRHLVITVIDETTEEENDRHSRVKELSRHVAVQHRDEKIGKFQFLWMVDSETVNTITMSSLALPAVIVYDPTTSLYYLMQENMTTVTMETYSEFLQNITQEKIPAHGGTGLGMRLRRVFYDIIMTVLGVWQASRWLFLLMFGLPTVIVSVVCYSLCCMETIDEPLNDSDDEEEDDLVNAVEEPPAQYSEADHAKTD